MNTIFNPIKIAITGGKGGTGKCAAVCPEKAIIFIKGKNSSKGRVSVRPICIQKGYVHSILAKSGFFDYFFVRGFINGYYK